VHIADLADASGSDPGSPEERSIITVKNLVKQYGSVRVVDDLSLSIREGEIFGIIGPNGAGKTTTVECISGLRTPDSGAVSVDGFSPRRERDKVRALVGVQLQESALPPRLRVGEAVQLFASFYSNPLNPQDVLESLGIKDIERVAFKNLSGGQKQRVSIALAVVGNPKIAILDELTTGLDPEARRGTWALIERMRDRGVTVILVTHFMDEAETLCDRVALIDGGQLRVLDTPAAIAARAGGTRVRFIPSPAISDELIRAIDGVQAVEREDRHVTVTGTGDLAAKLMNSLAAAGIQVSDLEVKRGNLDDAFILLTAQDAATTKRRD
jgi:ABC-2 type transport system ATP-binding protein